MLKKAILALLLVFILASIVIVIPVSAGGNACDAVGYHGYMYGYFVRNEHADGNGYFLGPWIGRMQSCYNQPPKAPYWAGN
jgi:hypothetical protein